MMCAAALLALGAAPLALGAPTAGPPAGLALAAADADPSPNGPRASGTNSLQRNEEWLEALFEGRERDALLFVPDTLAPGTAVPLIFNYHGYTSSAEGQRTSSGMNAYAEREGFAVIYPNGLGVGQGGGGPLRSHNGGSCCPPANDREGPSDDVGLATLWVEEVIGALAGRQLTLDRSRIYSTGMSNGGFMSIRLGCVDTSLFAAVASVTGTLGNEDPATDEFPCDLQSS